MEFEPGDDLLINHEWYQAKNWLATTPDRHVLIVSSNRTKSGFLAIDNPVIEAVQPRLPFD